MSAAVMLWDSGIVPAGAAIPSPTIDTSPFLWVALYVNNSDAGARSVSLLFFFDDGVTSLFSGPLYGAPGGTNTVMLFGPCLTGGTNQGLILPNKCRWTLGAGGASNGRLSIWGRMAI